MCGIIGVVGSDDAVPVLLDGLARLEYRGYDSAGLAVVRRRRAVVRKVVGRVSDLREAASGLPDASVGVAHTRWATHGAVTEANAHPQLDPSGRVAVVHNGMIENAESLRAALGANGNQFLSETDTEVLAHLIADQLDERPLCESVRSALRGVLGTYGLVVLDVNRPDELVAARNGSPVVVGVGEEAAYVASDEGAIVRHVERVIHLTDQEIVTVTRRGYRILGPDDGLINRDPVPTSAPDEAYELGASPNFLAKEIAEQPEALRRVLAGRLDRRFATAQFGGLGLSARELRDVRQVVFLGCGSAQIAGEIGAHLVEGIARVPARAESAAEFLHRNPVIDPSALYVATSQSGETLDTLLAVREVHRKGGCVIGAVNVVGSSLARETDGGFFLHAGPEVSVASTKAFTNMAASFAMLAVAIGRIRDLSASEGRRLLDGLELLPEALERVLGCETSIAEIASRHARATSAFFIGRALGFPVAREGAQKLKELSYIHAEAYPASELKHGPLALVDESMPTFVIVHRSDEAEKIFSTIEQIRARGGPVVAISPVPVPKGLADDLILTPHVEPELQPIVLTVATQLLARHAAESLGRDIDRPRNLAKSVTVE